MSTQSSADSFALASQALILKASVLLAVILCTTRFISGRNYRADSSNYGGMRKAAPLPYWIPYLGHFFPLMINPMPFLQTCRQQAIDGAFALNLFGSKYIITWTPTFFNAIFEEPSAAVSSSEIRYLVLSNIFGADKKRQDDYLKVHELARTSMTEEMSSLTGSPSSQIMSATAQGIHEQVPNLVSFSESIVDQNPWERSAYAVLHTSAVEVSLFTLIRNFVGHISLPPLFGTEFLEAYPNTLDDLWDLEGGYRWLMFDMPRWLGIPALTRAHIARRRLLDTMRSLEKSMDLVAEDKEPRKPWRDLSDVGIILHKRSRVWRANGTPQEVRGTSNLNLLWAMSSKSSYLVFWTLMRIWATPGLVERVRDEIGSYARATQPPPLLGIPEPPRLIIDVDGLVKSCPLLKACFYECLRLYSTPTSARTVHKDMWVRLVDGRGREARKYPLDAGNIVAAPLSLHHYDPCYFEDPNDFRPTRFLRPNEHEQGKQKFVESTIRPWGIGESACPGRAYAENQVLAFVAGILVLWDFEPTDNKGWVVPNQTERSVISVPVKDVRVRLRPRELL